jgi:hypothetical protein
MNVHAKSWWQIAFFCFIVLLIVTACQDPKIDGATDSNPTIINQASHTPVETKNDTVDPGPKQTTVTEIPNTEKPTETQSPVEPTPAPTISDWRYAPISPEKISDRVFEIYQLGQSLGRDPYSFSVIGDCQSIPYVFMGPFGRGELEPDPAESQLWKAINSFYPSFKRWAVTARGGFTAASILNPLQADPDLCKPGETPLTCEFRLNNPAYVLITLETWLDPDSIERYEVYLRQIIDNVIERGAIPILLTKADAAELRSSQHIINPVIVNVAYEYQLPLVNFWKAAHYLDHNGIDPEREGFHLSQEGYDVKNILALRALYQVWTAVDGLNPTIVDAEQTPTATPVPTKTPEVQVSIPNCQRGCIYFGIANSHDGTVSNGGVFAYNVEEQILNPVLPDGFDLQDVSIDGNRLLANHNERLYEIKLTDGSYRLISDSFFYYGKLGAFWNEKEEIIYLDQDTPIQTENGYAYHLIPSASDKSLLFQVGSCGSKDFCQSDGIYRQEPDGNITKLEKFISPKFSPDGSRVAFLNPDAAKEQNYYHIWYMLMEDTDVGAASRRVLYFPEEHGFMVYPEVETYAFSPDSNMLIIIYNVYSEYYRHSLRLQTYLWNLKNGILYEYGKLEGVSASLSPRMVWSPDGNQVLFFLTDLIEEEYSISIFQTDLTTGEQLEIFDKDLITNSDFIYLTNLYWR